MQHQVETQWMGKMQFNALVQGHTVVMDAPERAGGEDNGPIPKPFVLTALSGCTGMDVIAILRREEKELNDLSITVTGEITDRHPIEYISMHVDYQIKGPEEYREAALAAVNRSQEKLCGVSSMLKKALPVSWSVHYNGNAIFQSSAYQDLTSSSSE